jgi:hypothetical protein
MSAKVRCSNCEKSVESRTKDGYVTPTRYCKATGEKISTGRANPKSPYYMVRKCPEFLPRKEYIDQFSNPIDRAVELIEKGKKIKDIIDPL